MLPPVVQRQIEEAAAVAESLRETASLCSPGQEALRARFVQGAQTIMRLIALLEVAHFTAKLNHDTILESRNERADAV